MSKYKTFWIDRTFTDQEFTGYTIKQHYAYENKIDFGTEPIETIERRALDDALRLLHNARYFLTAHSGLNGTANEIDTFLSQIKDEVEK